MLTAAFGTPAFAADNFPGTTITGASGSISGTTVGMTGETGEPATIGGSTITSEWFSWTAPSTGTVVVGTCNPTTNTLTQTDTVLAVYVGNTLATLGNGITTGVAIVSDDDGCVSTVNVNYASVATFAATAGTTYRIQIDTYGASAQGTFQLKWAYTNQAANVTTTVVGNTATEGGTTGSFTLALNAMPSGTATVTLGTSPYCTFSPSTLTFGIASGTNNWPVAQTVTVTAINNTIVDGTRTCSPATMTINGGGYSNLALTPPSFTVIDNDALVTIANGVTGNEAGPTSATFTVTQSGVSTTATTVSYSVSGTATSGLDFTAPSGSVTIPAGSTTATITIPVIDDAVVEGNETLIVTLTGISSGLGTLGATLVANNSITDNDSATITIANTSGSNETAGAPAVFTITQSKASSTPTVINVTYGGTATAGTDYTSTATVTIPAGSTTATLSLPIIDDAIVEGPETIIATLTSIASGQPAVTLGATLAATNTITDNDTATLTIASTSGSTEAAGSPAVFTITQSKASSTPTVINLTFTGTATSGTDYTGAPASVTIPAGSTTATITLPIVDDAVLDPAETIIATLVSIASAQVGVSIGSTAAATNTITDNDVATFTIGKSVNVSNITTPQTLTYTITVQNTGTVPLTSPAITDSLSNGSALALTSGPTLTSGDAGTIGVLDIGETWVYTATYAVTQANINGGAAITNTASFKPAEAALQTSPPASTTITRTPQLTTVKTASTSGPVPAGTMITYTYKVTNSGNVTMTNVIVSDTHNGTGPFTGPSSEVIFTDVAPLSDSTDATANGVWDSLAPGDTIKFTATYTVTQNDVDYLQ
ncbi:MAG: hypothetical protein KGO94_05980 [Alphaproteobacteria bacterium]|nr:hypothetical protein [Alphaproteobacteria bacterium]